MAYTMNGLNEVINMANNDTQVYIMDTQKKYYKLNEKGQLVIAKNKEEASIFKAIDAVIRIGKGKKSRLYKIVAVNAPKKSNQETNTIIDMPKTKDSSKIQCATSNSSLEALMQQLCDVSDNIKTHRSVLEEQLESVNLEICDLEHYLEFYDLRDEELIDISRKLQECRRKRRNYKDELARIGIMTDEFLNSSFAYSAHRVLARMEGLSQRKYTPRRLTELFPDKEISA